MISIIKYIGNLKLMLNKIKSKKIYKTERKRPLNIKTVLTRNEWKIKPIKDNFETPFSRFFRSALIFKILQFLATQAEKANQEFLLDNIFSNCCE